MPYIPTIAVDFDKTICDSDFPAAGPVKPFAKEALTIFRAMGFRILIWSCRTCHWHYDQFGGDPAQPTLERKQVQLMIECLDTNGIPYDEIDDGSRGKPLAALYIDDKGMRFADNWRELATYVTENAQMLKGI